MSNVKAIWDGEERRAQTHLTENQIEDIAEKAAEKAIERLTGDVYKVIGKSIVEKALYIIGALGLGFWLWLKKEGVLS